MAKSIKKHRYHFPEPVQILSGKLNDVFRLHSHDFIEIAFINDGSGEYIDNYGQLFLVPGDLFIMRGEDDYHGFLDMKSLEVINIIFEPGSLDLPYDQLRTITGYNILFEIGLPPGAAKRRPFMNLLPGILQQLQDYVNRIRGELKKLDVEIEGSYTTVQEQLDNQEPSTIATGLRHLAFARSQGGTNPPHRVFC